MLVAPLVMTIGELERTIHNGEAFLEAVEMCEMEAESSIMQKILLSDVKPYEAYLLGRSLHSNIIGLVKEELDSRKGEKV
jgi:hypothetical protein